MYIYHLTDSDGWSDLYIHRSMREAIAKAEEFMNGTSWANTKSITIHRFDTKKLRREEIAITVHDAKGAVTHYL